MGISLENYRIQIGLFRHNVNSDFKNDSGTTVRNFTLMFIYLYLLAFPDSVSTLASKSRGENHSTFPSSVISALKRDILSPDGWMDGFWKEPFDASFLALPMSSSQKVLI